MCVFIYRYVRKWMFFSSFCVFHILCAARATLIGIKVTGELTLIHGAALSTVFNVGDPMEATLTYDLSTPSGAGPGTYERDICRRYCRR